MGQSQSVGEPHKACLQCVITVEQNKSMNWKHYLKGECQDLFDSCTWANIVSKQLKKIKKSPQFIFTQKIQQINQEFSIIQPSRTSSYHSSLSNTFTLAEESKSQLQLQHQKEKSNIVKLMKETDIMEDDIYEMMVPKKSIQIDRVSYRTSFSRISNTPSHIFQEKYYLISQIEQEPQMKDLILKQLRYYINMTSTLNIQLNDNNHQLHQVRNAFYGSFLNFKLDIVNGIYEMQQFIRVFQQCVNYYYDLQNLKTMTPLVSLLVNDENMLNFIVSLTFDNQAVYNKLYDIVYNSQIEEIEKTRNNIRILKGQSPGFFNVPVKLALDLSTYNYLKIQSTYVEIQPYSQSVKCLQNIKNLKSPTSKMKILVKSQQKVVSSIKRFYNRYGKQYNEVIDSDDLLRIQVFILSQSQIEDISVHLFLIEKLASNKMLQGTAGYYFIMLYSAIDQLQVFATKLVTNLNGAP